MNDNRFPLRRSATTKQPNAARTEIIAKIIATPSGESNSAERCHQYAINAPTFPTSISLCRREVLESSDERVSSFQPLSELVGSERLAERCCSVQTTRPALTIPKTRNTAPRTLNRVRCLDSEPLTRWAAPWSLDIFPMTAERSNRIAQVLQPCFSPG